MSRPKKISKQSTVPLGTISLETPPPLAKPSEEQDLFEVTLAKARMAVKDLLSQVDMRFKSVPYATSVTMRLAGMQADLKQIGDVLAADVKEAAEKSDKKE